MKKPENMADQELEQTMLAGTALSIEDDLDLCAEYAKRLREKEASTERTVRDLNADDAMKLQSMPWGSRSTHPMAQPTPIKDLTDAELLKFFTDVNNVRAALVGIQTTAPWYQYAKEAAKRFEERGPERAELLEEIIKCQTAHLDTADERTREARSNHVLSQSAFDQYVRDTKYVLYFTVPALLASVTVNIVQALFQGVH